MSRRKRRNAPKTGPPGPAAIVVVNSANRKTGPCVVTYVAQGSCPVTCPLQGQGCYAEAGHTGIITGRLNAAGVGMTPDELALVEAQAIDAVTYAAADLRLHVVGDCRTNYAAFTVSSAAERYMERGNGCQAWAYTHAWWVVDRSSWGRVSVLASTHDVYECEVAMARGYACAIVVEEFENADAAWTVYDGLGKPMTFVPCPHQTRDVQCVSCRMCMDDRRLLEGRLVIAFRAHGSRRASVLKSLPVRHTEDGSPW